MSAGPFQVVPYETSSDELNGAIMLVRVQPETFTLTVNAIPNTPTGDAVTLGIFAQVAKSKRAYGVGCRTVTWKWDAGQEPTDYSGGPITLPVLTNAAFAAYTRDAAGTYLGGTGRIVGRSLEDAL